MSEYKPKFVANREWSKDIKFNNHWYHLKSLFDQSVCDYDLIKQYSMIQMMILILTKNH